jgi:CheY-like chemotaxis protein
MPVPSESGEQHSEHTIMIVEDELLLRLDLANQLHSAGFEIIEAQSGDEAVKILATNIDVDLILTDIRMPGQVDGLGLVSFVKRQERRIKVIFVIRIRRGRQ